IKDISMSTSLMLPWFRFVSQSALTSRLLFLTCAFCLADAFPTHAAGFKALIFSATAGYRHASITNGIQAIQMLAATNNFTVAADEGTNLFNDQILVP